MVKVFLVEDSPLVCERLEALLASVGGVVTVGRAIGAEEATRGIPARSSEPARAEGAVHPLEIAGPSPSGAGTMLAMRRKSVA